MAKKKKKAKKVLSMIFRRKPKKKAVRKAKKPVRHVKKRKVAKKPAKRAAKKAVKKPSKAKEDNFVGFEEVVVKCPSCEREFRVVKSSGFSMEGMLCQRCAAGGGVGFRGED